MQVNFGLRLMFETCNVKAVMFEIAATLCESLKPIRMATLLKLCCPAMFSLDSQAAFPSFGAQLHARDVECDAEFAAVVGGGKGARRLGQS